MTGDAFHTPIMFRKDDLVKNVGAGKIEEAKPREEREINWIHSEIDKAG